MGGNASSKRLTTKPKLKPCPWCPVPPVVRSYCGQDFWARCDNTERCPVYPCTKIFSTRAAAVKAWNTRHA